MADVRPFIWDFSQPMFNAFQYEGGQLGVDYSTGVDNRWPDALRNGPNRHNLDASSVGGTTANTNAGALIQRTSGGSDYYYYQSRGTGVAKWQWPAANATPTLATTQPSAITARGMSMVVSKAPSGTPQLSIGMDGSNSYVVVTTVAAENAADTRSANNEAKQYRILGQGPDRNYGMGGQTISGNVLSSTVNMDASAWADIATFADAAIKPTGFAMSENLVLWGTNQGVLILNSVTQRFFPAFGLVPANDDNCRAMRFIPWLGVLVPLVGQLRLQQGAYSQRVGPEVWGSPNVIQGTVTGIGYDASWVFLAMRNPNNSTSYLLAARPRQPGDWHANPLSYYCIGTATAACEWVDVPKDEGAVRTNPMLLVGADANISYYLTGRGQNWTDDANYLYMADTDQTIYGTMRRFDRPMSVERVIWNADNLASGRTVTMGIDYTTLTGTSGSLTITKENRSGRYALDIPANVELNDVVAFRPWMTLRTNTTASCPRPRPRVIILARETGGW